MYALTIAKNGLKLKESPKDAPAATAGKTIGTDDNGFPILPPDYSGSVGRPAAGRIRWTGQREEISKIAGLLSLDHPVVDQTGLTGLYDFKLEVANAGRRPDAVATTPAADPVDSAPDPFTAAEVQLGLKLTQKNLPFDVIVIDHIDKEPTAN